MKVAELMTREVACCRAEDTLGQAARLMWDHDCGAVPVIDSGGRAVAVITDRDICMCCWTQDRPPSAIPVYQAMSRSLHTCSPDDEVRHAEDMMRAQQIRRLPVIDRDGMLVGILSLADIAREAERELPGAAREVAPDEITTTLSEIVQPHRAARAPEFPAQA